MVQYTKQRDKFRCAPVAILNALRWASGIQVPYKKYAPLLSQACQSEAGTGTDPVVFDRVIRKVGEGVFHVRRVYHPKLQQIEEHLREGGAIVLDQYWRRDKNNRWYPIDDDEARHIYLVVGVSPSGGTFYTVNGFRDGTAFRRVSRERFKTDDLRFQRNDPYFRGWFLTKEN